VEHFAPWRHPTGSEKEAAARNYVLALAARLDWKRPRTAWGMSSSASPLARARGGGPAVLQGHLDMVCEKNEGTVHDFDSDRSGWSAMATG